jgi:hypothetical protein
MSDYQNWLRAVMRYCLIGGGLALAGCGSKATKPVLSSESRVPLSESCKSLRAQLRVIATHTTFAVAPDTVRRQLESGARQSGEVVAETSRNLVSVYPRAASDKLAAGALRRLNVARSGFATLVQRLHARPEFNTAGSESLHEAEPYIHQYGELTRGAVRACRDALTRIEELAQRKTG